MFNITAIPAFKDNYIWVVHNQQYAAIVDPGEALPVLEFLNTHSLQPTAILCTHRHADHIGGIAKLREVYNVPVYGRRHPNNPHITNNLVEHDRVVLEHFGINLDIIDVPGHLDDHIAFVAPDLIFCGDILFGAGCGRNFEGTPEQLHFSLQRLAQLPDNTRVYCAHEYTLVNIRFALACEPGNQALQQRAEQATQLRAAGLATIPSTIALEKATNPFMRCTQPEIIQTLQQRGLQDTSEIAVFTALRKWRNDF